MAKKRVGIRNGALFNQTSTLWNNLLAYYTGDGTPNDALGNYNGTLVNGTTYGTGKINQGFSFDGVNDYVNLGDNFDNDGTQAQSVSFWVKLINSTSNQLLVGKQNNAVPYNGWSVTIYSSKIYYGFLNNVPSIAIATENTQVLTTGVWYHIVATYNGSKNASGIKVYIDGSLGTQNILSDTLGSNSSSASGIKATISSRNGSILPTNGLIDEVGIWDRVLSESEVTELYNNGNGKQYTPPVVSTPSIITDGLVLNLDAGNTSSYPGTGTDWFDLTSNGNDGVLLNGASYITDGGGSISFDGVNDVVQVNDNDLFSFGNGTSDSPFSVETWVNFNSIPTNGFTGLVSKDSGGSSREWALIVNNTNKFFRIFIKNLGGGFQQSIDATNITINTNTWYNIVATYDGRGGSSAYQGLKLYINGVQGTYGNVVQQSYTSMSNTTSKLNLGSYSGGQFLNGDISTSKIYNKTLTDSEVLQNYNATKGRFGL